MEARQLTVWEVKERAGLLALETDEWREKRLIAEDPDTTGDMLARFAETLIAAWTKDVIKLYLQGHLLVEAVAAHPNTGPDALLPLFNLFTYSRELDKPNKDGFSPGHDWVVRMGELTDFALLYGARGLSKNPKIADLCLAAPDLCKRIDDYGSCTLLREAGLPLPIVRQLVQHPKEWVAQCARLHINFAGLIASQAEGLSILAQYQNQVRFGGNPDNWERGSYILFGENDFIFDGQSDLWSKRAEAALKILPFDAPIEWDLWKRSRLNLLQHLAHDGNRLVRWAAQTRLADLDFVFTWTDEDAKQTQAEP